MENGNAGYDRSERMLRWTAAGLAAACFLAALACEDERERAPTEMEGAAYAAVDATVLVASAPARTEAAVPSRDTTTPPDTSPPATRPDHPTRPDGGAPPTEPAAPPTEPPTPPRAPWQRYDDGIAAWKSGETTAAEAHLREWVAHAPDHVKGRINLARVLIETGRPREAKEHAALAADLDPSSVAARRVLARALSEAGEHDAALDMYEEALWLDPDDHWSLNNLGYLLILRGRHDEAVGPLALAARLDSTRAMFHSNLGAALEGAGYPAAALEAFAEAVALDSGHARAAASVARLREIVGDDAVAEVDTRVLADDYRKGLLGTPEPEEPAPVEYPWRGD